jgi:hypothetical protein
VGTARSKGRRGAKDRSVDGAGEGVCKCEAGSGGEAVSGFNDRWDTKQEGMERDEEHDRKTGR